MGTLYAAPNMLRRYHLHFHLKRRYGPDTRSVQNPWTRQIPTSPLFQSSSSFCFLCNDIAANIWTRQQCVLRKYTLYFNIRGSSRVSPRWRRRRIPVPTLYTTIPNFHPRRLRTVQDVVGSVSRTWVCFADAFFGFAPPHLVSRIKQPSLANPVNCHWPHGPEAAGVFESRCLGDATLNAVHLRPRRHGQQPAVARTVVDGDLDSWSRTRTM